MSQLSWETLEKNVGIPEMNLEMDKRCKEILNMLQDIASVYDNDKALDERVRALQSVWLPAQDQYGRTLLHLAALVGNTILVRSLVYSGAHVNKVDGIGQTPLTLALYKGHTNTAKFLITVSTADDICDVGKLGVSPIWLIKKKAPELESLAEKKINEYHTVFNNLKTAFSVEDIGDNMECTDTKSDTRRKVNFARAFNINVGDQKNTVTIQGCENRCPDRYSVHVPGGGDFHNRGYINESIARIAGQGGFWHVTEHVLKRPTINPMSYKKKFKDNNFNNNEEAILDYDDGLSIAMIKKFEESGFFPNDYELEMCKQMTGSHNNILLERLEEWIAHQSSDAVFSYHATFVNDLMPITRWCKECTRYGNGLSMEGVWMLLPQLYAQVGKINYRDEAFTQCVNTVAHLPLAYRKMYQQNRSVNVDGKQGRQLAGDEWVESHLVRPVKQYANAQSSFAMVELMSCSVNLLEMNRHMYKSEKAFNIHNTRKHKTPSSMYDCLKVAQFAVKEKWFESSGRDKVPKYGWGTTICRPGDSVSLQYVDPLSKGDKKAENEFVPFLHRKYPNQMSE